MAKKTGGGMIKMYNIYPNINSVIPIEPCLSAKKKYATICKLVGITKKGISLSYYLLRFFGRSCFLSYKLWT